MIDGSGLSKLISYKYVNTIVLPLENKYALKQGYDISRRAMKSIVYPIYILLLSDA